MQEALAPSARLEHVRLRFHRLPGGVFLGFFLPVSCWARLGRRREPRKGTRKYSRCLAHPPSQHTCQSSNQEPSSTGPATCRLTRGSSARTLRGCSGRIARGGWGCSGVHPHRCVLPQDHQFVFNRGGHGPLVGRFCPRLHHTQSVKFPLAFVHGDPLPSLWMYRPGFLTLKHIGLWLRNPVRPREWFLVPIFVVNEVVERIKNGTITQYVYDPTAARLVKTAS